MLGWQDNRLKRTRTNVTLAAGVTLERLESLLPDGARVVRVMPNTPMLVGRGVNAIAPGIAAALLATVAGLGVAPSHGLKRGAVKY